MQLSNKPDKLVLPFAAGGGKNTIPAASQIGIVAGKASLTDGFPPLTRTPLSAGGVPPSGLDMNGILFELSAVIRWANAGGGYPYDANFATDGNVKGYPKGARVLRSDGLGYWFNTVENNETDPEAVGSAAAGWVPDFQSGVTALTMTSSNVTLTPLQYGKRVIIISGLLTSNLNLIFPTMVGDWIVINNTTGAFTITCKTEAGTGVVATLALHTVCDGTNILKAVNELATLGLTTGDSLVGTIKNVTGAVARTQQSINRERLSLLDFDPTLGAGSSAVVAWNLAVAYMNAVGGNVTVEIPRGDYTIDAATTPITVGNCSFVGAGKASRLLITYTGAAFIWGTNSGAAIIGGGLTNCSIIYQSAPNAAAAIFETRNAARLIFTKLNIENANTIARLGTNASFPVSIQVFDELVGYTYNGGAPVFDLKYCNGFFIDHVSLYVNGVAIPVHPANMTTVAGTNFIQAVTGNCDTIKIGDSVLAERYSRFFYVYAASGVVIGNMWVGDAIADYCREYGVFLYADTGGTIASFHAGKPWLVAWEGFGLKADGPGSNVLHEFGSPRTSICGKSGIYIAATCVNWTMDGPVVYATNRQGGGEPAVDIRGSHFQWSGGIVNHDATVYGLPFQSPYGVSLITNLDDYSIVGVNAVGSTNGWDVAGNSGGSKNRIVSRNPNANYAGVKTTGSGIYVIPATTVAWVNSTPFTHSVCIRGGTVSTLAKNGTALAGATSGDLTIEPGESFTWTGSVAPNVTWSVLP